jgi:dipeptidyl aminopeptidase/acylaminoacyl peptidase
MKAPCRLALACASIAALGLVLDASVVAQTAAHAASTSAAHSASVAHASSSVHAARVASVAHASSSAHAKQANTKHSHKPRGTFYAGVQISPDGQHLSWVTFADGGTRLQIADADGKHAQSIKMPGSAKDCSRGAGHWSPDGSELAFMSNCGNKNKAQQDIYLVDTQGANLKARRLTHLDGLVHGLAWGPKGKKLGILYVKGDTHPVAATAASKPRVGVIGEHGVEIQQMATVDANSGDVHLVTPKSLFVYEFDFSPHAQRIAYTAAPPPGANNWWTARLYTQPVTGGKPNQLVDAWNSSGSLHRLQLAVPRFSPDGKTIAFIAGLMSDRGATGGDIYLVPADGGKAVDVTPKLRFSPNWYTWTGNKQLLVSSIDGARSRADLFTLKGTQPATHKALFDTPSALRGLSLAANHSRFVFSHSTFNEAPEIYAGRLTTDHSGQPTGMDGKIAAITNGNAALKPKWGKGVEMNWHNEGFDVAGWLLLPANYDPNKRYPMIVSVHGGPVWAVRAGWPRGMTAKFSEKGYFVFMPNPRGSLGQGEDFVKAVRKDMGHGDLRDILAGIDAVEKKYSVDDDRIGITGWSYGGFMSMFAPTQTQRFKASVAGAGLSDWQSYYGENMIDKWMIPFFGASVYDDPDAYAKSSAINFIKHAKTPTLIVVGQFDKETPAPQSLEMWHALRAMGVPTELVIYAGEGHGFHKSKDMEDVSKRTMAWFEKYLAPANE